MALNSLSANHFKAKTFTSVNYLEVTVTSIPIIPEKSGGSGGGHIKRKYKVKASDFDYNQLLRQIQREDEEIISVVVSALEIIL